MLFTLLSSLNHGRMLGELTKKLCVHEIQTNELWNILGVSQFIDAQSKIL
jgi:hypothetical protein